EMVTVIGPALLTLNNVQKMENSASEFRFETKGARASILVQPAYGGSLRVANASASESKVLSGSEPWRIEFQKKLVVRILPVQSRGDYRLDQGQRREFVFENGRALGAQPVFQNASVNA